jgi:hypothetical protein
MMTTLFKQYFNTYIKSGEGVRNTRDVARNFAGYYIKLLDKEILSKKTKAAQDKYLQKSLPILKYFSLSFLDLK